VRISSASPVQSICHFVQERRLRTNLLISLGIADTSLRMIFGCA